MAAPRSRETKGPWRPLGARGQRRHTLLSRYPTAPGGHSKTLAAAQGKPAALSSTAKTQFQGHAIATVAMPAQCHVPGGRAACSSRELTVPPCFQIRRMATGTRDAVEARDDGAAAFNDGKSPSCHAYRLCRASFAGFDSGRALLAGGVMGVGGGSGEGARRPDGDTW